jgi:thioredoxin-related protein
MCDYCALAHRPARNRGVVQEYDIDHFIAFQVNIGLDMNTLIADIQRGRLTKADSGAKKLNAQCARNTPIVSVFHR